MNLPFTSMTHQVIDNGMNRCQEGVSDGFTRFFRSGTDMNEGAIYGASNLELGRVNLSVYKLDPFDLVDLGKNLGNPGSDLDKRSGRTRPTRV